MLLLRVCRNTLGPMHLPSVPRGKSANTAPRGKSANTVPRGKPANSWLALALLPLGCGSCGSAEPVAQSALQTHLAQDVAQLQGCPARPRLGLFAWEDDGRDATLALAEHHGVTEVYLHANLFFVNERDESVLVQWIQTARARCIEVELLFGNARWMTPEMRDESVRRTQWTVDFAARHPEARPSGIHWDLEPQQRETWPDEAARPAILGELLDTLDAMRPIAAAGALPLTLDIGFFLDELSLTRAGRTRPMHAWVIDAVSRVVVMDYRDDAPGMLQMAAGELRYASEVGVPILLAVETREVTEGEYVSFYEEGMSAMNEALHTVRTAERDRPAFAGLAIHDRAGLEALAP